MDIEGRRDIPPASPSPLPLTATTTLLAIVITERILVRHVIDRDRQAWA